MTDHYIWWRTLLNGGAVEIHECSPQCGYFKIRDRRGLYKDMAPIKRPFIAAAIWIGSDNALKAEVSGVETDIDAVWPYVAKYPISYEDYAYWHQNEKWPETEK